MIVVNEAAAGPADPENSNRRNIPLTASTHAGRLPPSLRRQALAPGAPVGVTEEMCRDLVHAFYARIRADPVLGPIFNSAIGDRWEAHLAKLCDFWSSVMLMTGRFKGSPMAVHAALPRAEPDDFQRWLRLFRQTAVETCPADAAALFCAKAEMIAQSLQLGIAASRGQLPRDLGDVVA